MNPRIRILQSWEYGFCLNMKTYSPIPKNWYTCDHPGGGQSGYGPTPYGAYQDWVTANTPTIKPTPQTLGGRVLTRYRIITGTSDDFEIQQRGRLWPFWITVKWCIGTKPMKTLDEALARLDALKSQRAFKSKVVWP